jgi:hypothetical protein
MDKVKTLFYDTKQGLINVQKFYKKVKDNKIDITQKQVKDFYDNQPVNQVMKPVRKPKEFSTIYAFYNNEIFQMDIMVYDRYAYHNYKYILCVIDVHSRYASARAMTNRRMETILEKFMDILEEMEPPEKLQCDNEFNKTEFNELLETLDISVRYSQPEEINKNAIIERWNGTLALLLQKVRITTKRYDWYNYLSDCVYNYNHTIHSTTKQKPVDIWKNKAKNEQQLVVLENNFKKGDKVRIVRKRKVFSKGDEIKYSTEIYIVTDVKNNKISLDGVKRTYKPYELKQTSEIIMDNIEEPQNEIKANNLNKMLKRLDIDEKNIITGKRRK